MSRPSCRTFSSITSKLAAKRMKRKKKKAPRKGRLSWKGSMKNPMKMKTQAWTLELSILPESEECKSKV